MSTLIRNMIAGATVLIALSSSCFALNLSDVPLYVSTRVDPNVLFDMSIESPMIGAAYNDQDDRPSGGSCTGRAADESGYAIGTCYFKTNAYIGYFDPNKCYTYSSGLFAPAGAVINSNHECSGKWSGNFLNWATMTAIDEVRWALTGGNRSTDTTSLTVLQRANQTLGKGHSWFPLKKIGTSVLPGNVNSATVSPYSYSALYIYSHGNQINIGNSTATDKATNLYVRDKVCDSASLETNCSAYVDSVAGTTTYKPVGLIQNNAGKMRFALTSYLFTTGDNVTSTPKTYMPGGVLRSRMKYTGPQMYDTATKTMIANPNSEWDSKTGIFVTDPNPTDSSTSGVSNSGVINYLNKFGSNGYRNYDPAGQLFYEALEYFKNHGHATNDFVNGMTTAMLDGFPALKNWDDPIQYHCQKNFIVGVNDANPWLDKKLPGTAFNSRYLTGAGGTTYDLSKISFSGNTVNDYGNLSDTDNSINVKDLTNTVGSMEGINTSPWTNSGNWTSIGTVSTATGVNDSVGGGTNTFNNSCSNKGAMSLGEVMGTCPYPGKANSYYIAGLAYYANTQDIRPDLTDKQTIKTFMIDTQEYSSQPLDGPKNMLWLAAKYGGFKDTNGDNNPNVSNTGNNKVEWDADGDGIPDNYVLASEPSKLVAGLSRAFSNINESTSSSSAAATNSTALNTKSMVYQATYDPSDWSGQLLAYTLSTSGVLGTNPMWDASKLLPDAATRVVISFAHQTKTGMPFTWAAINAQTIDTSQPTALNTNASSVNDGLGSYRVNFLRGSRSDEIPNGKGFLQRTPAKSLTLTPLGDIVNTNPKVAGAPTGGDTDAAYGADPTYGAAYLTFKANWANRRPVIYAGANDGMLHGFDATLILDSATNTITNTTTSGHEVIAYVPGKVYSNLSLLTDPNYSHHYYADGSPSVGDAVVGGSWKTVLVSGLNKGGQGVFALDVTNPGTWDQTSGAVSGAGAFTEANASSLSLWEFTDEDDSDLGFTFSQPIIRKMSNGKWAAIFGNGYNNTDVDGHASTSGHAFLYIVYLSGPTGPNRAWVNGTDYIKIDTGVGNAGNPNGLASPESFDIDSDGMIDVVYAGDLQGNMWRFDVTSATPPAPTKLFQTPQVYTDPVDSTLNRFQPITSRPVVVAHPTVAGTQLVLFGTGKYLETTIDAVNTDQQSFYAIWDKNDGATVSKGTLLQQTITSATTIDGQSYQIASQNAIDWTSNRGWYLDLPTSKERHVGNPKIFKAMILFNSFIPDTSDPCSPAGTGSLYALSYTSGGMLPQPVFDTNHDGKFDSNDTPTASIQVGAVLGGTEIVTSDTLGVGVSSPATGAPPITTLINPGAGGPPGPTGKGRRITWRELID